MELPQTPSMRLDGKRALIAGASSGIGLACATALAEAGAEVVLAARREDKLAEAVQEMTSRGWKASAQALDITDIKGTLETISGQSPFDIGVNSAGLAKHGPSLETTPGDFDAVTDVNLKGAYFFNQAIAKSLIKAGKPGSIISISSQMGHVGGIERAVYCGTKFGVEGFTKAQAIEWGPKSVRVNTICPTFILTDFTQKVFDDPERRAWVEDKIKLGRVGLVEDIMGAVLYLASDAASLVTGTSILVDGGWTAD